MSMQKEELIVEPKVGQIYQEDRNDERYQILYVDDQTVLLRCEQTGRNTQNVHRIERRTLFDKMVESGQLEHKPDSDLDLMDATEQDWSDVAHVGEKTRDNLHEEGYTTAIDVLQADDNELLAVSGLGKMGLENLRDFAH